MRRESFGKRLLSMLLAIVMIVGILPAGVLAAEGIFTGSSDTDYLFFATDRHTNTSVIGNIINNMETYIGENSLEYLGLGGDMVGSGNSHPEYDSSTVLGEVTGATSSLSAKNVDIVAGIHDMNVNDDEGIVLPYQGGGAQIYEGDKYYVYGVEEYCISEDSNSSNWSAQAEAFVTWANGDDIDTSKVIIVLSHYPLHVERGDNDGAYYWHQALNTVATGSASGDTTVERNIIFFHGHNHTVDSNEYVYDVGDSMSIQNGSSTTSGTIYYTYATAGYLNQNKKATLVAITDTTITLTKYSTSGSGTAMTEVKRASTKVPTTLYVTGTEEYTVGAEFDAPTVKVGYSDNTTEEITSGYSYTGEVDMSTPGTYPLVYTCTIGGYTAQATFTVTVKAAETTAAPQLNSISVTTLPTKTTYTVGEELNTAGMVVTGTYSDGTKAELSNCYVYGTVDMTTAGEKTVTIAYSDNGTIFKTTFTITVEQGLAEGVTLSGIEITTPPTKIEYLISEELSLDGMVVLATFSDGSTRELEYKPFSTSTVYGGYELDNFSMYVEKEHQVKVTYTYGENTCTDTFTINVWDEDFADETTGVKVHVATGDYGVTGLKVSPSANSYVANAVKNFIKDGTLVAYDITLTLDAAVDAEGNAVYALTTGEKTVTLPIPNGVTNPVVYYVSDDGNTVEFMSATNNGDGTVSFKTTHFSTYVVGESTEITVPDPVTATVTGATTTEEKTVYVLTSSISSGNQYLVVNGNSAGSYYALANNSGSVAATGVTVVVDDTIGTYIELDDATDELWTTNGSSSTTLVNDGYYLRYNNGLGLSTRNSTTWSWSSTNSRLSCSVRSGKNNYTYYLTGGSSWSAGTSSSNVYFYEKQTVTVTTSANGTYSIYGSPAKYTQVVVAGTTPTITLGSNLKFVADETGDVTNTDTSTTATYTVYDADATDSAVTGDPLGVISGISGNVVTLSGIYGNALVEVSYTVTVNGTDYTVKNYIEITTVKPDYKLTINTATDVAPDSTQAVYNSTLDLSNTAITYVDSNGVTQTVSGADITWTITDANGNASDLATIADGIVAFGETSGTVIITATSTIGGQTVTDTLKVDVMEHIYTIDLHNKVYTEVSITAFEDGVTYYTKGEDGTYTEVTGAYVSGTTYYTASLESVTATIPVKDVVGDNEETTDVNEATTYPLWAVITIDGVDVGTLTAEQLANLTFISSNTDIATVDSATGIVTFTGAEGPVMITVVYKIDDDTSITDSVIFSVSADHHYVPEDGTNDFPEYPSEGSIRFDKTATAVGTFSETGIAKVELSMTGVPITTGSAIDVVVMLDMTGSMSDNGMTAAEEATKAFVKTIVMNEDGTYNDNRVAVYAFNSGSSSPYELVALTTIKNDTALATANTAIETASDKQTSGGTPFDEATAKVQSVLAAAKTDGVGNNRQQFCVFMSDGGPTSYAGVSGDSYITITNSGSSTTAITTYLSGYSSSTSSSWSFTLPKEYYTEQMKAAGVTVYTVGLLLQEAPSNPSPYSSMTDSTYDSTTDSLTSIGSHYYFTSAILKQMASDESKYIDIFNVDNADKATAAFTAIAQSILEAATDVKVTDKISDDFTMVFDFPNATVESALSGTSQEFYIEVIDYALTAVKNSNGIITDYVRGNATSLLKLYLGTASDGSYYAATANNSTNGSNAFATPAFNQTALGTLYYWTTTDISGEKDYSGVKVTVDGTTYYFDPAGKSNTASDWSTVSSAWFNMASGAYAYGTPTTETVTIIDPETNEETTSTNTTCTNLIIATPYFVYNASTRMLVWTAEKLSSSELALSYFLYLKNSGGYSGSTNEAIAGTYETNEYAYLNYTNFNGNECEQTFPVPQITWNGAQVSYVFYLVNEAGQPVNRAGRVVPMSEAVYVTDIYTYSIIWNDLEQVASLEAEYLADKLVPEVYKLYDAGASYSIHVFEDENAVNLNNHFVIGSALTNYTTYVFNTKADATKYSVPGTYAAATTYLCKDYNVTVDNGTYTYNGSNEQYEENNAAVYGTDDDGAYTIVYKTNASKVETGFDFSNTTVAFAVVWKPQLVEDTVVVDFGLDVVIDVTTNDALASGVVGVRTDAPNATINHGQYSAGKVLSADILIGDMKIGTATVENLTSVRFSFDKTNGMQFTEPLVFYYESDVNFYEGTELTTTSMYSSVTIIPATTVYYEDSFLDLTSFSKGESGTFTEDKTSQWVTAGTTINGTQDQDRPGASNISAALDADNAYGYDSAYSEMSKYSMGSAAKITVNASTRGEATFTFYGTGFDVIGLTSNTTGTLTVQVYSGAEATDKAVKTSIVDTYYGYVFVSKDMDEDGEISDGEGEWVTTENDPNALYQVPVIKIYGLDYAQYTVKITAGYNDFFNHTTTEGSYDLYLDAVRIYDPCGTTYDVKDENGNVITEGNIDDAAQDAYIADGEGWPVYQELRNNVIAATDITSDSATIDGMVFVDGIGATANYSDYVSYGPNNELYLNAGQAVVFSLNVPENVASVQLGMKSVGGTAKYVIADASTISQQTDLTGATVTTINTATDMYYDITDLKDKAIVIYCSEGILSLTNVKFTFTQETTVDSLYYVSYETVQAVVQSLNTVEPTITVKTDDTVTEDDVINVTVTTSTNVAAVSVNGTVITTYEVTDDGYVWTAEVTAEKAGEQEIEVVAYDAYGNAYKADETTVTVTAKTTTVEETIKTIVNTIINKLKSWFKW